MKNPMYEQALIRAGIDFEYIEAVPMEEINETRGRQLQARLVPLDHDLIESYMQMIKEGSEPPPLILWKPGRGMYIPLDGNQRIAANLALPKKDRMKTMSAYVVKVEEHMVAERLCWQFNNMVNGRRLSYDECLAHAITFVRKYRQPVEATAKDWAVKAWELKAKCVEYDLRDLGNKHNVDTSRVPSSTIQILQPLMKLGEDVTLKTMKAVSSGAGADDAKELVSDVGKAKTLDQKLEIIDRFAASAKTARAKAATKNGKVHVRQGQKPHEQLEVQLERIERILSEFSDDAMKPVGKEDVSKYRKMALLIANRLVGIYGLGSYIEGQGV